MPMIKQIARSIISKSSFVEWVEDRIRFSCANVAANRAKKNYLLLPPAYNWKYVIDHPGFDGNVVVYRGAKRS